MAAACASVTPASKAVTRSFRSAPATKLPGLPEVRMAPLMPASVATRSTAAVRSRVNSRVMTFIGRAGTSVVSRARPVKSISIFSVFMV